MTPSGEMPSEVSVTFTDPVASCVYAVMAVSFQETTMNADDTPPVVMSQLPGDVQFTGNNAVQ